MELKKNEHYNMTITDIGTNGEGIGKIDNFTIFVEGALPNEYVEVRIIKLKKTYGYGKLINILTPSPSRIVPPCPISNKCGGCNIQHLDYNAQLQFKTKKVYENIKRIGGFDNITVEDTIGMEHPFNYRNKAQYPVAIYDGELNIGFYALRSHNIINYDECLIGSPLNTEIIKRIRMFITENKIPAYDEATHKGLIRHILIRTGYRTNEVMVCLVINSSKFKYKSALITALQTLPGIKSIVLNYNTAKSNVILGEHVETLWGEDYISDYIGELKFDISPLSFFQVNPIQTKKLYNIALDYAQLTGDEIVIDAYCGIGTISLFLAQKAKRVYGVEIVEPAIEDAKHNAQINNVNNAEFIVGKSEEIIPQLYKNNNIKPDVIVVDPPRKGCDTKLLEVMLEMAPKRIVYVSCDSATLARDLKILCSTDKYTISKIQPVDMFPQTLHVECVVLMSRTDK